MKTIDEMIEILQGFKVGKKVESRQVAIGEWIYIRDPLWDFDNYEYRLAPEPKLVPYGPEDATWLVGRKARMKHVKNYGANIIHESHEEGVCVTGYGLYSFKVLLENFLDVTDSQEGVPFGRGEE